MSVFKGPGGILDSSKRYTRLIQYKIELTNDKGSNKKDLDRFQRAMFTGNFSAGPVALMDPNLFNI